MANDRLDFDIIANDKASTTMDKVSRAVKGIAGELKGLGKAGADGFGKLKEPAGKAIKGLGKMGAALALGAGVAIGAALVGGITDAMDVQSANAKLQAGLGLNKADSAKAGKIAGDLYKNAYGESVGEVSEVLTTVMQSGIVSLKDGETAVKGVTARVMEYTQITGEDATAATRAVGQMLKTGLAKNAEEAFDILVRGQQLGINKAEDLLDTFNEYGTQFRKIGVDGPLALGLMNQALQAGARDSDIAADAIKEFSIRAVDGSKTTVDGFKSLKLNAESMQKQIAGGGAGAAKGLDAVLDKLRAVKDPAERSRIAVELFGTQAEDLGDALYAMDPSSAIKGLGDLKGAADAAGTALGDTASSKITTVIRTIKMGLVDALVKYALPQLEKFGDWFNGPGKFVLISWALEGSAAVVDGADKMLGAIQGMVGGLAKFGKVAMIAAAGAVAIANPALAVKLLQNADALGDWATQAEEGIGKAREGLQGWKEQIDKTNTKVRLQADIADLESKLKKANTQLADPKLTKERKAQIRADITQLEAKLRIAKGGSNLADPKLTATKIAKLTADKTSLESQIRAAKVKLTDKGLTQTKRATLTATITDLQRKVNAAQTKINGLKGKTVVVRLDAIVSKQYASLLSGKLDYYGNPIGREKGGPVTKGVPYVVGEKRPEMFVPEENGQIVPFVPSAATMSAVSGGGGGAVTLVLESGGSKLDDLLLEVLQRSIRNKHGGDVQVALGAGRKR
jgi:phage-related minor tail protein